MVVDVAIGYALQAVPAFLDTLQVMGISIPIAILIWLMIYPMMMKVDFQSIKAVGRHLDCQLSHQAFYHVCYCLVLPFRLLWFVDPCGPGPAILGWRRIARCGSLYGHGFRLEYTGQRESGLYRRPSRDE